MKQHVPESVIGNPTLSTIQYTAFGTGGTLGYLSAFAILKYQFAKARKCFYFFLIYFTLFYSNK